MKPTYEEYEKAKQAYKTYCNWVKTARDKQDELTDLLAKERNNVLFYTEQAEKQREIIRTYEICEEIGW